jgi:flagellar basal body-associated protein FliL
VTDLTAAKIVSPARQTAIRRALLDIFSSQDAEGGKTSGQKSGGGRKS